MDPNLVLLATLDDILGAFMSETLNSFTNTEMVNLMREKLIKRLRNEAFDIGHAMDDRLASM